VNLLPEGSEFNGGYCMNLLKRFFKTFRDKDGSIKVKTAEIERLNSRIYFDYKDLSDLYDYASNKNFESE
jgi:hypothetical protein